MAHYETDWPKTELLRTQLGDSIPSLLRAYFQKTKYGAKCRVVLESAENSGDSRETYRRTPVFDDTMPMEGIVSLTRNEIGKFQKDAKQVADATARVQRIQKEEEGMNLASQIEKIEGIHEAYGGSEFVTISVDGPLSPFQVTLLASLDGVQKVLLGRATCEHKLITFKDVDLLADLDKALEVARQVKGCKESV